MRNGRVCLRRPAVVLLGVVLLLTGRVAPAQTCVSSNVNHFTGDSRREFRISSNNLGALSGVTSDEAWRASIRLRAAPGDRRGGCEAAASSTP